VEGPAEIVGASLRTLPGVTRVESRGVTDGVGTYVIEAERGRDVRREAFRLVTQQRWALLELRALGLSLEDVFIRIVAGEDHEAAAEEAPGAPERPPDRLGDEEVEAR
jgi:ABC-2 type transport system ATP-binding protein